MSLFAVCQYEAQSWVYLPYVSVKHGHESACRMSIWNTVMCLFAICQYETQSWVYLPYESIKHSNEPIFRMSVSKSNESICKNKRKVNKNKNKNTRTRTPHTPAHPTPRWIFRLIFVLVFICLFVCLFFVFVFVFVFLIEDLIGCPHDCECTYIDTKDYAMVVRCNRYWTQEDVDHAARSTHVL